MTDPNQTSDTREDLFFDARLSPHRSLGPLGFVVLMGAVSMTGFVAGLIFFLVGAWPVVGFLGLEVALVYLAFRINYRHGMMYETLRLTRSGLTVERVSHWGEKKTWRFQPYWLQVLIDDPPRPDSALTLRSHGKSLAIGRFLTAEERLDLAEALRGALRRAAALSPET
ncbi:MAG: DUF2244 domain-containing protein [Kiloniellaceae bacterium]